MAWSVDLGNGSANASRVVDRFCVPSVPDPYVAKFQSVLLTMVQPTVIVLGVVGNVLNLLILLSRVQLTGRSTNSAMLLLFWMSVNDLLVLAIQLPSFGSENAYYKCFFRYPFSNFFLTAIAILSATVAVDRFAAIKSVAAVQRFFTTHTRKLVAAIMAFAFCFNMPRFFEYQVHHCADQANYICKPTRFAFETTFLYPIGGFVNSIVPMFVMLTFGSIVIISFVQIRSEHQKLFASSTFSQRDRDANSRISLASRMVVATILLFAVCTATSVLIVVFNLTGLDWRNTNWGTVLLSLNNFVTLAKSSVNFILYCSTCSMYRAAVRELLFGRCKRSKDDSTNGSPPCRARSCALSTKTDDVEKLPAGELMESNLLMASEQT